MAIFIDTEMGKLAETRTPIREHRHKVQLRRHSEPELRPRCDVHQDCIRQIRYMHKDAAVAVLCQSGSTKRWSMSGGPATCAWVDAMP